MNHYAVLKEGKIKGFYCEDIHGVDYCETIVNSGGLEITEELWSHLLNLGESEFIGEVEKRLYTIEDKELFEKVVPPLQDINTEKTEFEILKETVEQLVIASLGVI